MNERILNDAAWRLSQRIVEMFDPMLREMDRRDVFLSVFARVKAGFDLYEIEVDRVWQRLHPGQN